MRIIFALVLLMLPSGAWAQAEALSPQARFHEGAAAYRDGHYAEAEDAWRGVVTSGAVDGHVLYDLGNALYRQGRVGSAMLAWRQALVLLPREPDARANLALARDQVRDRIEPSSHVPPLFFWQHSLANQESGNLGALLLGFALGAWAWLRWRRRRGARELGSLRPAAWVAASLGLILLLATFLTQRALETSPGAVILAEEIAGRSALGRDGVELFVVHEGAELRALERDAGHVLVALPDGRRGWIPDQAVGLVQPGEGWESSGE
jgi:tetratricopeptide (TPR) repeat protein